MPEVKAWFLRFVGHFIAAFCEALTIFYLNKGGNTRTPSCQEVRFCVLVGMLQVDCLGNMVKAHIAAARTPWHTCMAYAQAFVACISSVVNVIVCFIVCSEVEVPEVPLLEPNDLAWVGYPGLHRMHQHWGFLCTAE
eukprot:SM000025S08470  [mRNA]  locus=s25:1038607:1039641:- [translate_table: standard]